MVKRTIQYAKAIDWIALNDESMETKATEMVGLVSVTMVGDLFKVPQAQVAIDVIERRKAFFPRSFGL